LLTTALAVGLTLGSGIVPVSASPTVRDAPRSVADYPAACSFSGWNAVYPPIYFTNVRGNEAWIVTGGNNLWRGQQCQIGKARLVMQSDGNLVVYDEYGAARWASNTYGVGDRANIQHDGNFVVYDSNGTPHWASNTCCTGTERVLSVQSDGNVVIYQTNGHLSEPQYWTHIWATDTHH
jgi:hypothetical protein